jgi:hypothetical protein
VRIVLADARDLRATVVTVGRHPSVSSIALPGRSGGDPPVNLAAVGGGLVFETDVTEVATGGDRVMPHVGRRPWEETYGGAISADGRYLALPLAIGCVQRVALVDVRLDRSRLLRGPRLAAASQPLGWDPVGDTLFYVTAGDAVARYRPGAGRAVSLPVHLAGPFVGIAVLG